MKHITTMVAVANISEKPKHPLTHFNQGQSTYLNEFGKSFLITEGVSSFSGWLISAATSKKQI